MPRGRPKEFDRDEALDAALAVFQERGYDATGVADLTEAMGIGKQSLYDTFGDKRSLFLEALGAYCSRQRAMIRAMLEDAPTPGAALAGFLDAWPEMLSGPMANGCLVLNSITESVGRGEPKVIKALAEQMELMGRDVEDALQRAIDSGEVTAPLAARDLAATIHAAANGLALRARLSGAAAAAADVSRSLKALLGLSRGA